MFVWSVGALEVIVVVDGGCDVLERVIGGFSFEILRPHGNCGFFLEPTDRCSRVLVVVLVMMFRRRWLAAGCVTQG
jgi:hypothetical protein